jgi:hypothetical protein
MPEQPKQPKQQPNKMDNNNFISLLYFNNFTFSFLKQGFPETVIVGTVSLRL